MNRESIKRISLAIVLSLIALLSSTSVCLAEAPNTSYYNVANFSYNNGVPTGEANAVLQTTDGYIWIGGYGGLQRYDGTNFEQFGGVNGLKSYSIRALWQAEDGMMFVGSNEQGLFFYNGKEFRQPDNISDFTDKYLSVRCFEEDDYGRVWVGTSDGLAYMTRKVSTSGSVDPYSETKVYIFDLTKFGYSNSTVYTLSKDENGIIWAVDYSGSVIGVNPQTLTVDYYLAPGELWENLYAYSALAASDGSIYAGTNANAILHITFTDKGPQCEVIDSGNLRSINAVCEKENGEIWFCGDYGVGYIDNNGFADLSYLTGSSFCTSMIEDYEHNIWMASSKYGVFQIQREKVAKIIGADELEKKETYSICNSNNQYFVGAENGVLVFDANWNKINHPLVELLQGVHVHKIIDGHDGNVYLGTYYNGMYIYNHKTGEVTKIATNGSRCRDLLLLSNGNIAIGTNSGVDIYSDGAIIKTVQTPAMVLCLLEMPDHTLLCGTDGKGICQVNDKDVTQWSANDTLSGGVILRMTLDNVDTSKLWVSCGYDVFYGSNDGFSHIANIHNGNGSILDIFVDGNNIWLFRSSGILEYSRDELLKTGDAEEILYLSANNGIPGPVVANSWSLFENGQFAICTIDGIGIFDASNIFMNNIPPKAIISNVSFSDGTKWDGSEVIKLDSRLSKLVINFAALSYCGDNAKVIFWLDGLDDAPIEKYINEQNEVEYTNLKAGTYVFHLTAVNSDGIRSVEKNIVFNKSPKFVETIWFYILIVLVTGGIVALIASLRIKMAKRKQEEYKQITDQTIATISGAIDAKDPYTEGHSRRVSEIAVKIARKMGMSEDECERLKYISLLHDIGKIGVPDEILKKPAKLTDDEFDTIKHHTVAGAEILKNFTMLPGVTEGARYHHEKYDGTGYCEGLKGEEIPVFARIISVADAYDAMNSSRCYRAALDKEVIISELEKGKYHQFDPKIANIAIELLKSEE